MGANRNRFNSLHQKWLLQKKATTNTSGHQQNQTLAIKNWFEKERKKYRHPDTSSEKAWTNTQTTREPNPLTRTTRGEGRGQGVKVQRSEGGDGEGMWAPSRQARHLRVRGSEYRWEGGWDPGEGRCTCCSVGVNASSSLWSVVEPGPATHTPNCSALVKRVKSPTHPQKANK